MKAIANRFRKTKPLIGFTQVALLLFSVVLFGQSPPESGPCGRNFLNFDGTDDYLDVQGTTINGSAGTWEAWVRKNDWTNQNDGVLFGNDIAFDVTNSMYLSFHSGVGFHFRYGDVTNEPATGGAIYGQFTRGFTANSWHHIAVTWEHVTGTTTLKMFIDGVEQTNFADGSRPTHNALIDPGSTLNFGRSGSDYLEAGALAEIRTWDVARTETEIVNNMNTSLTGTETGLTGYWPLDEASGTSMAANLVSGAPLASLMNMDASTSWVELENSGLLLKNGSSLISSGGTLDFGGFSVDDFKTIKISLENNSGSLITFSNSPAINLTGTDAAEFSIDQSALSSTLMPGAIVYVDVVFAPTTEGTRSAELTIASDDGCLPTYSVLLSGIGVVVQLPVFENSGTVNMRENNSFVTDINALDGYDGGPDENITYSLLGSDADILSISAEGVIAFKNSPDYEAPEDDGADNVYNIIVRATSDFASQDLELTITVEDNNEYVFPFDANLEEVGGATGFYSGGSVANGRLASSAVALYFSKRPINTFKIVYQTGTSSVDFQAQLEGNGVFSSTLPPSGGVLTTTQLKLDGLNRLDMQSRFGLQVSELYFEIPPLFFSEATIIKESDGNISVVDVNAADGVGGADDDGITYSLVGGADVSLFNIDPVSGLLTFQTAPEVLSPSDFNGDNIYEIEIEAANANGTESQLVTVTVVEVNVAPVLDPIENITGSEDLELTFNFSATDANSNPVQTLTASIDETSQAKGMSILPSETLPNTFTFSWTPSENQDGDHTVTITVTDDGEGTLTDEETITITVNETNQLPVLDPIGDKSIDELLQLSFTLSGSDADVPAQNITYNISDGLLPGMLYDGNTGQFLWEPREDQSGTHSVTFEISDDFSPTAGVASETITITVNEVNVAPVLASIGDQSIDESSELTFTASATDSDDPVNILTYSIDATSSGKGMTIDSETGAFSWTPSETQDGEHTVVITVTDDGEGNLTDEETITITVNDVNVAPVLASIGDQTIDERSELTFTAIATDVDIPANNLTYSIDATSLDKGMSIDGSTGAFSWTPSETQDGEHTVVTTVTDDGEGNLTDEETISITVNETNQLPLLDPIGDKMVDELSELAFTLSGSDADVPAQNISYSITDGVLPGMSINASSGEFSWTPAEDQSGMHTVTLAISDDFTPEAGITTEEITITVNETNQLPLLDPIGDKMVDELSELAFTLSGSDADVPAQNISYSITDGVLPGMSINASSGEFSWTPAEDQSGMHSVTFEISDDFIPTAGVASETITITVNEVNVAPVLASIEDQSIDESSELTFNASATDSDDPVNTLTYSIDATSLDKGMTMDGATGAFSWTPSESQVGDHTVVITVTDDGLGNLFDEATFNISVIQPTNIWDGTSWSRGTSPLGNENVRIDAPYTFSQHGVFAANNLTIGSELRVDGNGTLVVNGDLENGNDLIIESGASLITFEGNSVSGDPVNIERNTRYADGKYSFVGTPVQQSATITESDLGSFVYGYDESEPYGVNDGLDRWIPMTGELVPGAGYTQSNQQEIVFTGIPNDGDIVHSGTYTEDTDNAYEGWNLVANPYPAAINVGDFLTENDNTTGAVYIWDDNGSDIQRGTNADYIVANAMIATNSTPAGMANRYNQHLGSAQAFFIKLEDNTNTDITFTENMRRSGNNGDDNFFRKQELPIVRLNLTNSEGLFKQAVVGFASDASSGKLNRTYDAQAFNATSDKGLFTVKAGRSLTLNGMTKDWESIQLQLNTKEAGEYQISIELEGFHQAIYLRDNLTKEVIDLRRESYSFFTQTGIDTERFELISNPSGVLGLEEATVLVYANSGILYIRASDNRIREYQLFNMQGKQLMSSNASGNKEIRLHSLTSGIYLVFDGNKTHKIILK